MTDNKKSMTSRERVLCALDHRQPDMVPLDFGASPVTGIHASLVFKLRRELGLTEKPVKVTEPYQMLGEIDDELARALKIDVVKTLDYNSMFGYRLMDWKPWTMFDGTPVLIPGKFNTTPGPDGDIFSYPEGDPASGPSGRMPKGGLYFDAVIRQNEVDDETLNAEDNLQEFTRYSDEYLRYTETAVNDLYHNTDKAIVATPGGTAIGDIALVPAIHLKNPTGIRDIEEWYISLVIRKDYIKEVFDRQSEIAVENLKLYKEAVGNKVAVIYLCGTDLGTQTGPFCSVDTFKEMYMPYYKRMTTWIHENTSWKIFKHCCGSIVPLIPALIESGMDILNPVQCSAANMEPSMLKQEFGDKLTFWGGGVDTQKTLPFGTPDDVREQVRERIGTLGPGGGFVFNTIHNAQADVPAENFLAMMEAFDKYRTY